MREFLDCFIVQWKNRKIDRRFFASGARGLRRDFRKSEV
jgi:hypothetical protein